MTPLISVALCTYNGERHLSAQLKSILHQTYKNIEIVICDDCSTDSTNEIIEEFSKFYPIIKHYKNQHNLGFNKNFEQAIHYSTGDFIAISDQDDIWELDKLEKLLNHIGDNWLVFSNSKFINNENKVIDGQILADHFTLKNRNYKSLYFSNFVTGHTVLFSRKFLHYLFPIPKLGYYDWWMGFVATYHHKITYCNEQLTLHRIHQHSAMFRGHEVSLLSKRKERAQEINDNLLNLINYKHLNSIDKEELKLLHLQFMSNQLFQKLKMMLKLYSNYKVYFPNLKYRNMISRINYAYKFVNRNF
jgi:glycosyltransferase involved in cell wall biosynthesis